MRIAVVGAVLGSVTSASAEVPDDYLFLEGSVVSHEERIGDKEVVLGGRFGFGGIFSRGATTALGLEVGIFHNPIKIDGSSGDKQTGVMLDLMQYYSLGGFNPYVFAGIGLVGERAGPAEGIFPALEVGGGLLLELTNSLTGRASISAMSVHNDKLYDGTDAFVDYRLNVGLMWPFGSVAPVATAMPVARATDSDGDGLADDKDGCPSTPASTADGCPAAPVVQTDADGDGVYDSQDECAGTLSGLKVDSSGCAVRTEVQVIVLKGVTFLSGSATLTGDAKAVLDAAATSLSADKSLNVELGGHTDSQGKDAANLALSQRRADSVRLYLIGKGVEGSRLSAKGYGELSPIADNNTIEGRAENRRVELKVVQ